MGCKKRSLAVRVGVLSVLTGVLAGGCSSYEAPNLKVVEARVSERSAEGVVLMFTLDAENPNEEGLPLRSVDYRVLLDGREVFTGTRSAEATLRRYGTQQIRLPAVVAMTDPGAVAPAANYRIEGTLSYITPGEIAEILFDAGVRQPSVGFSGEGKADMTAAVPMTTVEKQEEPKPAPKPEEPKKEDGEKKAEEKK
ncbi:MAG: LEA type 2 family protein [Phycisphaerales bacterium]|nr:LEA type 2 family protein [Phycisphaerales bacterium]